MFLHRLGYGQGWGYIVGALKKGFGNGRAIGLGKFQGLKVCVLSASRGIPGVFLE